MLPKLKTDREAERENLEEMLNITHEDIKSGQADIRSAIGAVENKIEAPIHSFRSKVEETIQYRMKNVMSD
jgi:hypothetical protein